MDEILDTLYVAGPSLLLLFFVWLVLRSIKNHLSERNRKYTEAVANSPIPVFTCVVPETTCSSKSEPHKWEELLLASLRGGEPQSKLVCMNCGVINGTEHQFDAANLAKLKEGIAKSNEIKAFYDELDKFREVERERRAGEYGLDKSVFLAGYNAFSDIEKEIEAKIDAKRKEEFQKVIEKITGISNGS